MTARFHRLEAAEDAGYELGYVNGSCVRIITGCIAHQTAGAMGYHYFNKELIDDLVVDPLKPEGLVYAPGPDGRLQLAAVEYVVPGLDSNPPGVSEAPTVFGRPMVILVPAVGFYTLHAWVWSPNPEGMFAHWNPQVVCPQALGEIVLSADTWELRRLREPAILENGLTYVSLSGIERRFRFSQVTVR